MNKHILIVEDQQDVSENLQRKIKDVFQDTSVSIAHTCDLGFQLINQVKISNPVNLLILDLVFKNTSDNDFLKKGTHLIKKLKENKLNIPTIIYTTHNELNHIYPVINNYNPEGYIIKSHNSTQELLLGISRVLNGETYYSQLVHNLLMNRYKYEFQMDEVDIQIIKLIPEINCLTDWEQKIYKKEVALSTKAIKNRIQKLLLKFEVENEIQLALKFEKLGFLM